VPEVRSGSMTDNTAATMLEVSKHHDLIYDVGMYRGEDSEFYLRKGFRVIGFEADPDLAELCRRRLARFVQGGKLTVVEGAIVDSACLGADQKSIRFFKGDDVSAWGTIHQAWAERNEQLGESIVAVAVPVTDFREALATYGIPRYMKIDIEGSDLLCLAALSHFKHRPDYISIESNKTAFSKLRNEIEMMSELGYTRFKAVEQSRIPTKQSPPYPAREGAYADQTFVLGSSGLFGAELGGPWRSRRLILTHYWFVRSGYFFLGDNGIMNGWSFPGSRLARFVIRRLLGFVTRNPVPGWYDTHARHADADAHEVPTAAVGSGQIE